MRFIGNGRTYTREEVAQSLERAIAYSRDNPGLGLFATVVRATDAFIGWTALKHMVPLRLFSDPMYATWRDKIEIGYRYLPEHWGRGYATEAARALLEHGFRSRGLDVIHAIIDPQNAASIRVLEKIGMRRVGPVEYGGRSVIHFQIKRA